MAVQRFAVRHLVSKKWYGIKQLEAIDWVDDPAKAKTFDTDALAHGAMFAAWIKKKVYEVVPVEAPAPAGPTDWQGKPVPPGEEPDDRVLAWEVTPHPRTGQDAYVERSWQDMLRYVEGELAAFLERFDEAKLRAGVTLTFKVVDSSPAELENLDEF